MPPSQKKGINAIIDHLVKIEKEIMPKAQVFAELPDSVGNKMPAILNWHAETIIQEPQDVTLKLDHTIEVRVIFSKMDSPKGEREARSWLRPFQAAISRDPYLDGLVETSKVTGWKLGLITYATVQFIGFTITVIARERVAAGEVEDEAVEELP